MSIARTYHESIEQNDVAIVDSKYIYIHMEQRKGNDSLYFVGT